jgi:hypothetical protein
MNQISQYGLTKLRHAIGSDLTVLLKKLLFFLGHLRFAFPQWP